MLEIGCGNLSQGKPLIDMLAPGHYCGIDPAGWLVEAALAQFPSLEHKTPHFVWNGDFDADSFAMTFDYVLAHSVLSHCAHWQLDQMLSATRRVVHDGTVFLCSYRRGEANSFAEQWAYPGVNFFRLETIQASGLHTGWRVEEMPTLQQRLRAVAPNDVHDWLRLTAVPSAASMNELRLSEEERIAEEREEHERAEMLRREEHEAAERAAGIA